MKTIDIGALGENAAVAFLKKQGLKILGRNLHFSHNEIDVVAKDTKNKILVFVEVKTRSLGEDMYLKYGAPSAAVTKQKQQRLIEAARSYIFDNCKFKDYQIRFDVTEVYISKTNFEIIKINHIENAFGV